MLLSLLTSAGCSTSSQGDLATGTAIVGPSLESFLCTLGL